MLTDDQGYGELGAHGNPDIRPPELDRLHSEIKLQGNGPVGVSEIPEEIKPLVLDGLLQE